MTTDLILIPESVSTLPGRTSKATHDLVFIAKDIPALGVTSFYVEVEKGRNNPTDKNVKPVNDTIVLDNGVSNQNIFINVVCTATKARTT